MANNTLVDVPQHTVASINALFLMGNAFSDLQSDDAFQKIKEILGVDVKRRLTNIAHNNDSVVTGWLGALRRPWTRAEDVHTIQSLHLVHYNVYLMSTHTTRRADEILWRINLLLDTDCSYIYSALEELGVPERQWSLQTLSQYYKHIDPMTLFNNISANYASFLQQAHEEHQALQTNLANANRAIADVGIKRQEERHENQHFMLAQMNTLNVFVSPTTVASTLYPALSTSSLQSAPPTTSHASHSSQSQASDISTPLLLPASLPQLSSTISSHALHAAPPLSTSTLVSLPQSHIPLVSNRHVAIPHLNLAPNSPPPVTNVASRLPLAPHNLSVTSPPLFPTVSSPATPKKTVGLVDTRHTHQGQESQQG